MIKIKLDKLEKAKWNYKTNDPKMLAKLINNIRRNGQIENLIVRKIKGEKFEVVNGNHRLDALANLGIKSAWCYDLGEIKPQQAKRIAIETNETRFSPDNMRLAELFKDISKDITIEELAHTMPFNEKEIDDFLNLLDVGEEEPEKEDVSFEVNSDTVILHIKLSRKEYKAVDEIAEICKKYKTVEMREK